MHGRYERLTDRRTPEYIYHHFEKWSPPALAQTADQGHVFTDDDFRYGAAGPLADERRALQEAAHSTLMFYTLKGIIGLPFPRNLSARNLMAFSAESNGH
eukprot:637961-Prymnesium_polylepis.1